MLIGLGLLAVVVIMALLTWVTIARLKHIVHHTTEIVKDTIVAVNDPIALALTQVQVSNAATSASLIDIANQLSTLVANLSASGVVAASDLALAQDLVASASTLAAAATASDAQIQQLVTSTAPASGA